MTPDLTDEQVDTDSPAFREGVAIMDTIDPELYRRLGELFGQPDKEQS